MARYINEEDVKKLLCLDSCQPGSRCPDAGFCKEIEDAVAAMPGVDLSAERPARDAARWIPVGERLPEVKRINRGFGWEEFEDCYESDPVLVFGTISGKRGIFTGYYSEWRCVGGQEETSWNGNEGDAIIENVVAWMPLPEPYKEAENA